jgi:hypothetical protein
MDLLKLKNLFFPALLLLAFSYTKAQQTTITGIVFSSDSLKPVPFVSIFSAKYKNTVITNDNGVFQISISFPDTIKISAIGFISKKIVVNHTDSGVIQKIYLDRASYQLNEIKIQGIKTPQELKQAILNMQIEDNEIVIPGAKQYKGPVVPAKPNAILNPISAVYESKWAKKKRAKKWNKKTDIPKMR